LIGSCRSPKAIKQDERDCRKRLPLASSQELAIGRSDEDRLLAVLDAALATGEQEIHDEEVVRAARRMVTLSPRERQVLEGIVAGKASKLIAFDLGISVRTVEVHRTRLLVRLDKHSMAEAIRIAVLASLDINSGRSKQRAHGQIHAPETDFPSIED
jgi:DNA-binding NarL/FixJ family response regulator